MSAWIAEVMTRAPFSVDQEVPVGVVEARARDAGIRHVVVTADDRVVGVACVCDLRRTPKEAPVAEAMSRPVIIVRESSPVGEATFAIRNFGVGCLPVVSRGRLIGVVTRSDLLRHGIAPDDLGIRICAGCGGHHEVAETEPAFCIECLERATFFSDEELGEAG